MVNHSTVVRRESPDRFTAVFEIAMPGSEYSTMEDLFMEQAK